MAPVPKRRSTRSRTGKRRKKFTLPNFSACGSCGNLKLPHTKCPSCGAYNVAKKAQTLQNK